MSNWDTLLSVFLFLGQSEIALGKQTAIVVSLETPFLNWVDEDVLFYDEYYTNLLRYGYSHLLCHDTKRKGLLSQNKKSQNRVCPYGQLDLCQLIFYTCLTCV